PAHFSSGAGCSGFNRRRHKHIRLIAHEPHRFAAPPDLADPEYLTMVHIDCFAGRSVDAKRALYRAIVERLGPIGIPGTHVSITVRDIPMSNWGIRAGQAACDVDLGFDVEV
ncbi:MAG TPA: tautomerase family protein, partial [Gordonia sp. (in: high G+C Gram-positive bacteria)]|uniref:tautomerase family protein n=1 Tax=Gordonia sp. (in: high G+C Gram-positive bacteria) TaxID=84139 RepID=UPI002603AE66